MRHQLFAVVSCVVAVTTAGLSAQPRGPGPIASGTASIRGTVFDAQSGEPLADVAVRLGDPQSMLSREVKTNADGVYAFAAIAAGEYTVMASSWTHIRQCHGATDQFRMQCVRVLVVPDQQRPGIDFRLQRGAILRGRVVDHEGRPVAGASVWAAGKVIPAIPGVSDKDGAFELTNILGDEVTVAVDPRGAPDEPRPPTIYYPGVVDPQEATTFDVSPGSVATGLSIVLPRVASSSITMRVASSASAVPGVIASLIAVQPRMVRPIDLSAEGVGTVRGLPEGRYFVSARARSGDDMLAAFEVVDLVRETYDLNLLLQPAGRITGRMVAQRGGLPPIGGVRVAAAWIDHGVEVDPLVPDQVEAGPDGFFSIDGVFGTRTLQLIGLSTEWQVQAVLHGRSDITTTGVEVLPDATVEVTIVLARR